MSRTDRDVDRWWWHNHYRRQPDGTCEHRPRECDCIHQCEYWKWHSCYSPVERDVPPAWKRDQRRQERAKYRNQMDGADDWDDMTFGYFRPWYY